MTEKPKCLKCQSTQLQHLPQGNDEKQPEPGSILICIECSAPHVFMMDGIRPMEEADWKRIGRFGRSAMFILLAALVTGAMNGRMKGIRG